MTYEELLEYKGHELEAMTDKQLDELFAPVYCVTRPEMASKNPKTPTGSSRQKAQRNETLDLMKQLGMNLEGLQ